MKKKESVYVVTLGLPKERFLFMNYRDVLMKKYKRKRRAEMYIDKILKKREKHPVKYDWVVNPRVKKIKVPKDATRFDLPIMLPRKKINLKKKIKELLRG